MSLSANLSRLEPQQPYLFHLEGEYGLSYAPSINGLIDGQSYSSFNNQLKLSTWLATLSEYEFGLSLDFNKTDLLAFNFNSVSGYIRKNLLDDLSGDKFGLDLAFLAQFVPNNRLKDPLTEQNDVCNFHLIAQVYKNILFNKNRDLIPYVGIDAGIANRGYPWFNPQVGAEIQSDSWYFDLLFSGFFGLGPNYYIDLTSFKGYAYTAYRAVDMSLKLGHNILDQGYVEITYDLRLFSINFPQQLQGFLITIDLPIPIL